MGCSSCGSKYIPKSSPHKAAASSPSVEGDAAPEQKSAATFGYPVTVVRPRPVTVTKRERK